MFGLIWNRRRRRRENEENRQTFLSRLGAGIDRTVKAVFPGWGMKRLAARSRMQLIEKYHDAQLRRIERLSRNSWTGARKDHLRSDRWLASDLTPDSALDIDLPTLQNRCAELYRTSTIGQSAIEGRVSHEVGIGIQPQARINWREVGWTEEETKQVNREIEDVIDRWSSYGVDQRRISSLQMFIRQVGRCFATYGEAFIEIGNAPAPRNGPLTLALKLILPERVETPYGSENDDAIRLGVEHDANGAVVAYHVRTDLPGDVPNAVSDDYHERIERFWPDGSPRMIHVFDPLLPEQSRGIPWLAAAINRIKDLDDFFEAELIGKQIEACFGLLITTSNEGGASPQEQAEGSASETLSDGSRIEDMEPGGVNYLAPGEEASQIDPNRPGSTFAPFVEASLRSIAAALNYPYELLAKNFFRTTFSSGRLAQLDGKTGFLMRRSVIIEQFLDPLYRAIIFDGMFMGELPIDLLDYRARPYAYERHKWQGQAFGMIDPEKEIKANALALETDQTSLADVYAEQGKVFAEEWDQITKERLMAVEQDVEVRARRAELEEDAGLPPSETDPEETGATSDAENASAA